jgi:hypothetical protein
MAWQLVVVVAEVVVVGAPIVVVPETVLEQDLLITTYWVTVSASNFKLMLLDGP